MLLGGTLGMTGCGNSDADYGKPGDSTLPDAIPFESSQSAAPQAMPEREK
jgi:hypothetical protein